jgi:hypothetical protein
VFPARYELNSYIVFRKRLVSKRLMVTAEVRCGSGYRNEDKSSPVILQTSDKHVLLEKKCNITNFYYN